MARTAANALATEVQYLTAKVLELGGNATKDASLSKMGVDQIETAIVGDEELDALFHDEIRKINVSSDAPGDDDAKSSIQGGARRLDELSSDAVTIFEQAPVADRTSGIVARSCLSTIKRFAGSKVDRLERAADAARDQGLKHLAGGLVVAANK